MVYSTTMWISKCKIQPVFEKREVQKAIHLHYFQFIFGPFVVFENIRVSYVQWRSQVSWCSGWVITAVAHKININFKKILVIFFYLVQPLNILNISWPCTDMRIKSNCVYEDMWIYYTMDVVLHVLATYSGHLQGIVFRRIYYKEHQILLIIFGSSHLQEWTEIWYWHLQKKTHLYRYN